MAGNITQTWGAKECIIAHRTPTCLAGKTGLGYSGGTRYSSVVNLITTGYHGAQIEVWNEGNNATDDFNIYVFNCMSGVTSGGDAPDECYEQPILSTSVDGSATTKITSFTVLDVPYFFVGVIPDGSSTTHFTGVTVQPYYMSYS